MKRVTGAAMFGTVMEWYDFFLYGLAAALIFPRLFFPETDPLVGTLLSFSAFATGFLARPLGGILFGHFGDRFGRKRALVATLLLMGFATIAIGLLPTYEHVGVLAPVLLVLLRIAQGLGMGGEWGGAALLTRERRTQRPGFYGSFLASATFVGLILASLIFAATTVAFSEEALYSWGWRIPFLLSAILVIGGIYIRRSVDDTPNFIQLKQERRRERLPVLVALRAHPRNILAVLVMRVGQTTSFWIIAVFTLTYATDTLGLPESLVLTASVVAAAVACVLCPVYGTLGDRFGYRRVMVWSFVVQIAFAFPFFLLVDLQSFVVIVIAVTIGVAVGPAASDSVQAAWFSQMFGASARYSGVSLGRETGAIIGGGFSPLIATGLLALTGAPWAIAGWMAFTCVAGLGAAYLARPVAEPGSEQDLLTAGSDTPGAAAQPAG